MPVSSVSSTATNGSYGVGSVIPITVTFDESVIVTGAPLLEVKVKTDTDYFEYLRKHEPETLRGERVKSFEELLVLLMSNFNRAL